MRYIPIITVVALFLVCLSAQTPTATLVGHVTDPTGAPIPGATVQVRNVDTNAQRVVKTETAGDYAIPNLSPGRYTVIIEKEGFRRLEEKELELQVNQTARLDAQLQVGTVTESIEVTARVPVLNTDNAVKGDVIVTQEITEMPLNGRSLDDLAFLVPEVADADDANSGSGMAINGARNDNTNFVIDGINNNDLREGGSLASVPIDSVQEFKMQTSGYSAEFGRLAGGVMTVALKTGGNRLHGALFEFLRNDKLDARNFFAAGKDKLRRNQFGANLDGPVVIPKLYHGRDRTFFVFTWESYRQVTGSSRLARVPTDRDRQGDFSGTLLRDPLASGNCTAADPGACFPGSRIPASRFSPAAVKLIPYYPVANRPGQVNNYLASATNVNNFDSFVFKFDHRLGSKDTLSVRYMRRNTLGGDRFAGSDLGNLGAVNSNPNQLLGLTFTHLVTPTFINEFRGGFARERRNGRPRDLGHNVAAELGIPGTTSDPQVTAFPRFSVRDMTLLGNPPAQPFQPTVNTFTWADTVSWVRGRHLIKFGGDVIRSQMFQPMANNMRGTFNFLGRWTNVPFADLLLGLLDSATRQLDWNRTYTFATNTGFFVQDDYKIRPRLTLNLGLRYERNVPIYDKYDRFGNFVLGLDKLVIADNRALPDLDQRLAAAGLTGRTALARDVGLPRSLTFAQKRNFAPRFGLAWRPFGNRLVVRGGYGIYYAGSFLNSIKNDLGATFPFVVNQTFSRVATNPNALTLANPFPADRATISGVTTANGFETRPPAQYMQAWNLTLERELKAGLAVEAGYTGSKGTHLGRRYNINQPFRVLELRLPTGSFPRPYAGFNTINYTAFGSNSIYSAGVFTLRKRFSHGVFYRASYVFSKTIDDASIISGSSTGGFSGAQDARNLRMERGRSDYDSRHVFTMNFTYEAPRTWNRWARGWQLAGTGRAASGQPFTPRLSNASLDLGEATRPDRIGSGKLAQPTPERWFDASAFLPVPTGAYRFGNSGRNILDGPGRILLNFSLSKKFYVAERQWLQFRWEAFNVTNHPNFGPPQDAIDAATVGTITRAGAARVLQFGLRYQF